jgi:hypothetical protein
MRRSSAAASASPVSLKPEVKKWRLFTPLATQSSITCGTADVGTEKMTWSTGSAISRMLA